MKIRIVGGGITGLAAAWYAQKRFQQASITLYEKQNRLGGWIQTSFEGGFLFEKGPRTFQASRSGALKALIDELGIPTIASSPHAKKRFIYHKGKLRSIGSFIPMLIPYFVRELFIKPRDKGDESIYSFASRRFSPRIAKLFFDPLTLGIYAGDIHKLSIRSCFPALHKMEQKYGSLVRAGLKGKSSKQKGLFTIKSGMQTLVDQLEKQLKCEFVLNKEVERVSKDHVIIDGERVGADLVLDARPPNLPKNSIWVVNLGYNQDILQKKGFGYLVPSMEGESVLGVIFDSSIFPEQNQPHQTRLTAMVRSQEKEPKKRVLNALKTHLGIDETPALCSQFLAFEAIPQFCVGCGVEANISVDACIRRGRDLAESELN